MTNWTDTDKSVLREHARKIAHMRKQFHDGRFSLVLGAGVSKPLGTPDWRGLNERIAEDAEVNGVDLLDPNTSETVVTKRLYEHFKSRRRSNGSDYSIAGRKSDLMTTWEWRNILHKHLYAGVPHKDKRIKDVHPYLSHYLTILRNSDLTVNYNFDDHIERMLLEERLEEEKASTRGYQSVCSLTLPFRKNRRVIYHPNGFVPSHLMEGNSDLVFADDEYADQLIGVMAGLHSAMIHHLCTNTCLFIGISLNDVTLKHLLRQVTRMNPGHCHYYVQYYTKEQFTEEQKKAISKANFDTYNLITLFLNDDEIVAIGKLLTSGYYDNDNKDSDILLLAKRAEVPLRYCYYVVGCIGAGKSTTIGHFRDLVTYDEWLEPRSLELGKEPEKLRSDSIAKLDAWIADQFCRKNHKLSLDRAGLILVDRCPLDPISFTPREQWAEKAKFLIATIGQEVVPGHIIFILDDPAVMELRVTPTAKQYSAKRLQKLQEDLKEIYTMDGVTQMEAHYLTSRDLVKQVAEVIHRGEYCPIDIDGQLHRFAADASNT
jgi:hypothetical protein